MYLLAPYERDPGAREPTRRVVLAGLAAQAPGGPEPFVEAEALGDHAVCLVTDDALRATFAARAGVMRLPAIPLLATLAEVSASERAAIRDAIEGLGYPRAEWRAALGADLAAVTLLGVLRFILTRRHKPRLDVNGEIRLDGPVQATRALPLPPLAGAAFPTAGLVDNFNRANEGPPPSASWSNAQTGGTGGLKVVSNECVGSATGALRMSYWSAATFGPDCEVYADVVSVQNNDNDRWLDARLTTPGASTCDGYRMKHWQRTGTDELEVHRIDNSVLTQLGADFLQDVIEGDKLGFELVGSTLRPYYKIGAGAWTSPGSRTDSTYTAAGYIGLGNWQSTTTSSRWDNFSGGTAVTAQIVAVGQASAVDSAQATTRRKAIAIGQVVESVTAQAVTRRKAGPVVQVSTVEAAQPVAVNPLRRLIGQASAVEVAYPATARKLRTVGQAVGVETAQPVLLSPVRRLIGQVAEASAALTVGRVKARLVAQAVAADSAQPVTRRKARVVAQATATDAVQALTRVKGRLIGQASTADAAQPVARNPLRRLVTQAVESVSAHPVTRVKARLIGQPSTTDAAALFTRIRSRLVGQASAADSAQAVAALGAKVIPVGQPSTASAAQPVAAAKRKAVATAADASTANPLTVLRRATLGQVTGLDAALVLTVRRTRLAGQASAVDSAQAVLRLKALTVAQAAAADAAQALTRLKRMGVGQASVTDSAQAVLAGAAAAVTRPFDAGPPGGQVAGVPAIAGVGHTGPGGQT